MAAQHAFKIYFSHFGSSEQCCCYDVCKMLVMLWDCPCLLRTSLRHTEYVAFSTLDVQKTKLAIIIIALNCDGLFDVCLSFSFF